MINKNLVKERFKKNLKTYTDNSIIQKKMADKLLNMIPEYFTTAKVLELGCGSGAFTKKILQKIDYKSYTAIDIVDDCKYYLEEIDKNIKFIQADIEEYIFEEKYDLIMSNATFQWIENLPEFINKLKNSLTPNGILIFSTFGKENFKEIKEITNIGLKYYSKKELEKLLTPKAIKESIINIEFKTPKDVLKHLKLTGVNSITQKHWTKSDLINFETKYNLNCNNKITLTYNPIYVML